MSKLRASVLETIRTVGNHSGCHQRPDRSFFYQGYQFPVCARCTGVFVGELLAIGAAILRLPIHLRSSLAALSVMGIDWLVQEAGIRESTNIRRLITGISGGFGLFSLYRLAVRRLWAGICGLRHK